MNATVEFVHAMQDKGVLVFEDATRAVRAVAALARMRAGPAADNTPLRKVSCAKANIALPGCNADGGAMKGCFCPR